MHHDDYRPIPCAWHSECLQPQDLETRDGAEYLLARDRQGHAHRIRLDRIREARTDRGGAS